MLSIDVLTIFPELFEPFLSNGVLGGACANKILDVQIHDLRDWSHDSRRTVDDVPYGGGAGMVMKPGPMVDAIEDLAGVKGSGRVGLVALLTPQGKRLDQQLAERLSRESKLLLVCGRYEGVDQRVVEIGVDLELSIGDYVLSGGEVPAMVLIEALSRFVPGVLGNPASIETESFSDSCLEGPQYTRPVEYRGLVVPEVLRSGHHGEIAAWKRDRAREVTEIRRPDLLKDLVDPKRKE